MKGRCIDELVFETMFEDPKPGEPTSFHACLQKHLVNEVRAETTAFYGSLDTREAQYPGLDYSYPPHRVRLSRFPWHRRLFRTFDALGLTKNEIKELTKWEGTAWAKERFEKEQNIKIRDTAGDCILDWVPPHLREPTPAAQTTGTESEEREAVMEDNDSSDGPDFPEGDESDMEVDSVGVELNRRLLAGAAQREAGGGDEVLDEEFEEWLKQAVEQGRGIPGFANSSNTNTPPLPPRLLNAARLQELPESVRNWVRAEWTASSALQRNSSGSNHRLRQTMRRAPQQSPPNTRLLSARPERARGDSFAERYTMGRANGT